MQNEMGGPFSRTSSSVVRETRHACGKESKPLTTETQGNPMPRLAFVLLGFSALLAPSASGQAVPTFVDVPTFLGAPLNKNLDETKADFAVLGVPFDEGTWGWPGERYGARGMRESSQEYNHDLTEGFYYIDRDSTVLKGKHWVDVGDVPIMPTVPSQTGDKITERVRKIRSKG